MKRTMLFLSVSILALIFGGSDASLQSKSKNKIRSDSFENTNIFPARAGGNTLHKIFIRAEDRSAYESLRERNAVAGEVDYGSFKMVIADEINAGGYDAMRDGGFEFRDDQDVIPLNGYTLETSTKRAVLNRIPADLRQTAMDDASAGGDAPGKGLYIVQFIGPIKDEWLDALRGTGSEIVSYISSNAYVVNAGGKAAAKLTGLREQNFVQFIGDYEPAFRLSPVLQEFRGANVDADVRLTVQVIDGRMAKQTIVALRDLSTEFVSEHTVLNYRNVAMSARVSRLGEIASMENVFAVEERSERERHDEAQGQISAGNLTGTIPTAPGYLAFLAGKGFDSTQFGTFVVEVVDDAYNLTGASVHPDLPAARVAFQNNPSGQAGNQGGHGFLNSHIVGGFNSGTGAAVEDANGYNYGLGIAPWARLGVTAIFGPGSPTSTSWENTAYGVNARISTNSWGYTGLAQRAYTSFAQEYDVIVRDAQSGTAGNQQLITLFSVGNNGSLPNTVSAPSTAKNVISVGAGENVRQTGTDGCGTNNAGADSANDIIGFSSRGPVNAAGGDGRIKPDIVAPGTHIEAGIPQASYTGATVCNQYWPVGQTLYGWSSGTSHSTPAVAGGAALVYQDFINKALSVPSPAMTKAILMNSAAYMSGTGAGGNLPSNSQGMGRMDLGRTFDGSLRLLTDQTQVLGATGNTFAVNGSVANVARPLRITLVWSDAAGPTVGNPAVNNLDLELTMGATTFRGNVFSGANSVSGGSADTINNAESIFLPAGTTGVFTVTVRATNIAGNGVPGNADATDQDFALVIYNASPFSPTAAEVSVSGQVKRAGGYGVSGARVTLAGPGGEVRTVITNPFGFYNFDNVPVGQTYVVSVSHKRFQFAEPTQLVNVQDQMTGVDFVTLE